MRIRLDELRTLIRELIDKERARGRFFVLVQQAIRSPASQGTLFGYMRSVGIEDSEIQRVRLLLKGTDKERLVSYIRSLAHSTFGD